ncbi:hypothetical protein C8Q77DRAFT_1157193 [Trametes polyzona]|nr:hypothetical protein C8Q77DRAFT_1157193 [Trametes polyzona]
MPSVFVYNVAGNSSVMKREDRPHTNISNNSPRHRIYGDPRLRQHTITSRIVSILCCLLALANATTAQTIFDSAPPPVQCFPGALSWRGGQGPYTLTISAFGMPGTSFANLIDSIQRFGVNETTFTWVASFPAGTLVSFEIKGQDGSVDTADGLVIGPGTNDACLPEGVERALESPTSRMMTSTVGLWTQHTGSPSSAGDSHTGHASLSDPAIVGAVIGGLLALAVLVLLGWLLWRRKRASRRTIMRGIIYNAPDSPRARPWSILSVEVTPTPETKVPPGTPWTQHPMWKFTWLHFKFISAPASLLTRRTSSRASTAPPPSTLVAEDSGSRGGDHSNTDDDTNTPPPMQPESSGDPVMRAPSLDLGTATATLALPPLDWSKERWRERRIAPAHGAASRPRPRTHAADGGVRLAGGPIQPVGRRASSTESSTGSTLPPPYNVY